MYKLCFFFLDRHYYRYEQKLARLLWKVDHKEIVEFPTDGITSNSSFEMRMNIPTPGASVTFLTVLPDLEICFKWEISDVCEIIT